MDEIRNTFIYLSIYFTLLNNVRCLKGAFHFKVKNLFACVYLLTVFLSKFQVLLRSL